MLRVLAWPAGRADDLNPYVSLIHLAFVPPAASITAYAPSCAWRGEFDVFHIQWPEAIFEGRGGRRFGLAHMKALLLLHTADRVRARGGIVALTLHNLRPHARFNRWQQRLYRWFHERLLARTDLMIGLSAGTLAAYREAYPAASAAATIIPHPSYRDAYTPVDRAVARAQLGLVDDPAPLLAIAGSLRASKQTPNAITTFRATRGDARLLVAGDASDEHWAQIVAAADPDPRVVLRRGPLSPEQLANVLGASDAALLNQTTTLNSGSALLALSLNRAVLAPAVGGLVELAGQVGADWLRLFHPPLTPVALAGLIAGLRSEASVGAPDLTQFDANALSDRLLAVLIERHDARRR